MVHPIIIMSSFVYSLSLYVCAYTSIRILPYATLPWKSYAPLSRTARIQMFPHTEKSMDIVQVVSNSFLSEEMQVYIEDTDAYAVIYNGNYLRIYERALHLSGCSLDHPNWFIQTINLHKFKSSPRLGEKFRVKGERHNETTWNLKMIESITDHTEGTEKIYNTAQVTLSIPQKVDLDIATNKGPSYTTLSCQSPTSDSVSITNSFFVHRDELMVFDRTYNTHDSFTQALGDIHYMLPLRNVLNFFERARSNFLGGPNILRQMQAENNILWVVTSIDDLKLHYPSSISATPALLSPGHTITVKTNAVMRRKGMIVEFHQAAVVDGNLLADGVVTICAIDNVTGKPTSNIPLSIRNIFTNY